MKLDFDHEKFYSFLSLSWVRWLPSVGIRFGHILSVVIGLVWCRSPRSSLSLDCSNGVGFVDRSYGVGGLGRSAWVCEYNVRNSGPLSVGFGLLRL